MNSKVAHQIRKFRFLWMLAIFLIVLLFVDFYLSTMSNIVVPFAESIYVILLFTFIVFVAIFVSNYLLNKLFNLMEGRRTTIQRFKWPIRIMQYSIYAIVISIIIQILIFNEYFTLSLISVVTISYSCSIIKSWLGRL